MVPLYLTFVTLIIQQINGVPVTTDNPLNHNYDLTINELVVKYMHLALTFDPEEIPLDNYLKTNLDMLEKYHQEIQNIRTRIEQLNDKFKNIDVVRDFFERVNSKRYLLTKKPLPYKLLRERDEWEEAVSRSTQSEVLPNDALCAEYLRYEKNTPEQIQQKIAEIVRLFTQTLKQLNERKNDKPFTKEVIVRCRGELPEKYYSVHHIISKNTIIKFLNLYNDLLVRYENGSSDISRYTYRILDHNSRKVRMIDTRIEFGQGNNNPNFTKMENEEIYRTFSNRRSIWPDGLVFFGPKLRNDDPRDGFEVNCEVVVGREVFLRAQQLYNDITQFINTPPSLHTPDQAFVLHERLYGFRRLNEPTEYPYVRNNWNHDSTLSHPWSLRHVEEEEEPTIVQLPSSSNDDQRPCCSKDAYKYDNNHSRYMRSIEADLNHFNLTTIDHLCKSHVTTTEKPLSPYRNRPYVCRPENMYWMLFPPVFYYCRLAGYYK